ncbi:MAG: hypothetical protein RR817_00065, partial [Niameybacter sp.]
KVLYAVHLHNEAFWEINRLEVTNQGETPLEGRTGIMVSADEAFDQIHGGTVEHIYLNDVFVRDVNGHPEIKDQHNGGIFYCINSEDVARPLIFKDIVIENCHVKNVHRTGISVGGTKCGSKIVGDDLSIWKSEEIKGYLHQDIIIRNNYIECVGGDALVPMYSYKPLIEHNTSQEASIDTKGQPNLMYNAAIWPWQCYEAVFQYNEAFRTYLNGDGQAYDCDWSFGTLYQYNYSHDNQGGFMLVCQKNAIQSKIQNNISYNDQRCIFMTSNVQPAYVENNIVYIGKHLETTLFSPDKGPIVFENNVFYKEGESIVVDWHEEENSYDGNYYKGFEKLPEDGKEAALIQLEELVELADLQAQLGSERDEEALHKAWQEENERRRLKLENGTHVYGCKQYTFEQYKAYVESNRELLK